MLSTLGPPQFDIGMGNRGFNVAVSWPAPPGCSLEFWALVSSRVTPRTVGMMASMLPWQLTPALPQVLRSPSPTKTFHTGFGCIWLILPQRSAPGLFFVLWVVQLLFRVLRDLMSSGMRSLLKFPEQARYDAGFLLALFVSVVAAGLLMFVA